MRISTKTGKITLFCGSRLFFPSARQFETSFLRGRYVKMHIWIHPQRCVRMAKMQGAEDEGAGSVLKYMTKPESDSNEADWLLWNTAWLSTKLSLVVSVVVKSNSTPTLLTFLRTRTMFKELLFWSEKQKFLVGYREFSVVLKIYRLWGAFLGFFFRKRKEGFF